MEELKNQVETTGEVVSLKKLTENFEAAMSNNDLAEAEKILYEEIGEKKGERWLDIQERELQNRYYGIEDYDGVKRIIEKTKNPHSQSGRIKKYESVTGKKYEGPRAVESRAEGDKEEFKEVVDSKSFRDAIDNGEFERAQEWLDKIKEKGYKGLPQEEVERIIRHRESELIEEKAKIKAK